MPCWTREGQRFAPDTLTPTEDVRADLERIVAAYAALLDRLGAVVFDFLLLAPSDPALSGMRPVPLAAVGRAARSSPPTKPQGGCEQVIRWRPCWRSLAPSSPAPFSPARSRAPSRSPTRPRRSRGSSKDGGVSLEQMPSRSAPQKHGLAGQIVRFTRIGSALRNGSGSGLRMM